MTEIEDLKRKADDGDAEAQCELGLCYLHGKGSTVDLTEALRWFLRSAKQQNPGAAFNLAQCFAGNVYELPQHTDDEPSPTDDEVNYDHMTEGRKWAEVADFYNELHQAGWTHIRDYLLKLSAGISDKHRIEGSRRAGEFLDKWGRDKN